MGPSRQGGVVAVETSVPAQYLTFKIAAETYAVGILRVREILQFDTLTRVPGTPVSIRGVMNLRGSVVPVVDLAVKLGMPESVVTARTCVVILEVVRDGEELVIGVMADSVREVVELRAADIEPPPPFGSRVKIEYLVGLARADSGFVLVLDTDRILPAWDLDAAAALVDERGEEEDRTVHVPAVSDELSGGLAEEEGGGVATLPAPSGEPSA